MLVVVLSIIAGMTISFIWRSCVSIERELAATQ